MKPYVLPLLLLNFVSFLLVVLITLSAPFTSEFYFLQAPTVRGLTRFGLLGWQEMPSGASVGPQIGYYAPQLINGLTYSLVLVPIAGLLCLFSLITLVPQMTSRHQTNTSYESGTHAPRSTAETLFWGATYINTLVSLVVFVCSLVLFVSAHEHFRGPGVRASTSSNGSGAVDNASMDGDGLKYGPCLWMQATSLAVALLTPLIRIASRMRGEKRLESLESAALEPRSERKV